MPFIAAKDLAEHSQRLGFTYPDSVGSLIDGERVARSSDSWDLVYAATGEVFSKAEGLSVEAVDDAARNASAAFERGDWRKMPLARRQAILRKVADLIDQNADELAYLQTVETGIPYAQFRAMHVARTAENFRFFADVASTLAGETYQQTGTFLTLTVHEPIGVGLVIAPWNAPLVLSSMSVAACLITGNSCIVKPSEFTPYSVLRMCELMIEAGVPETVIQVANGMGATTGSALVSHPSIDAVSFIGGTQTGKRIMAGAAEGIKKVSLELGGKSANIILDNADLEAAIDGSLLGIFAGNGQQCLAGSRMLVHERIYDEFVETFVARTRNLRIGDPFADGVEIGPLAFAAHYQRVGDFIDKAAEEAQVLTGKRRIEGAQKGYFIEPVVAAAPSNDIAICQEEIFAPFVTVQKISDLEQAIGLANASSFGLVSYVWTKSLDDMMQAAQGIRSGTVWVNTPMARDLRAPFGGYKMSGIGRDGLPGSIEHFTEQKSVMLPSGPLTLPKLGAGQAGDRE